MKFNHRLQYNYFRIYFCFSVGLRNMYPQNRSSEANSYSISQVFIHQTFLCSMLLVENSGLKSGWIIPKLIYSKGHLLSGASYPYFSGTEGNDALLPWKLYWMIWKHGNLISWRLSEFGWKKSEIYFYREAHGAEKVKSSSLMNYKEPAPRFKIWILNIACLHWLNAVEISLPLWVSVFIALKCRYRFNLHYSQKWCEALV